MAGWPLGVIAWVWPPGEKDPRGGELMAEKWLIGEGFDSLWLDEGWSSNRICRYVGRKPLCRGEVVLVCNSSALRLRQAMDQEWSKFLEIFLTRISDLNKGRSLEGFWACGL